MFTDVFFDKCDIIFRYYITRKVYGRSLIFIDPDSQWIVKGETENIFRFADHTLSFPPLSATIATQKQHGYDVNEWVWLCSNDCLFTKTGNQTDVALL